MSKLQPADSFLAQAVLPGNLIELGERSLEVKLAQGVPEGIEPRAVDDPGQSFLHCRESVNRAAVARRDQRPEPRYAAEAASASNATRPLGAGCAGAVPASPA